MDTDTREPELDTLNTRPWIRRSCAPRAGQSRPDPARPAIMMMIMIMIIHAERDQRHSHCGQSRPGPTGPARSIPLPLPRAFSLRRGGARTVGPPRDEPPQLSPGRRCRPSESTRRRCSPRPPPRRCGSSRPCRRGPPSRPNRPPAPPHPPHAPHAASPPPLHPPAPPRPPPPARAWAPKPVPGRGRERVGEDQEDVPPAQGPVRAET